MIPGDDIRSVCWIDVLCLPPLLPTLKVSYRHKTEPSTKQNDEKIKIRGLFQRVILQSGVGGFAPSFHHHTAEQAAKYDDDEV